MDVTSRRGPPGSPGSFLASFVSNRFYRAVGAGAIGLVALYFYTKYFSRNSPAISRTPPTPQSTIHSSVTAPSTRARTVQQSIQQAAPQTRPKTVAHYSLSSCLQSTRRIPNFRISCATANLVIRPDGSLLEAAVPLLQHLAGVADLYLMHQCTSNEEERRVIDSLTQCGFFSVGLSPHVLFCQTAIGRAHMARQLEVHVHIDDDAEVMSTLAPHIGELVFIGNQGATVPSGTTIRSSLQSITTSP